jgi:hypothetical protein
METVRIIIITTADMSQVDHCFGESGSVVCVELSSWVDAGVVILVEFVMFWGWVDGVNLVDVTIPFVGGVMVVIPCVDDFIPLVDGVMSIITRGDALLKRVVHFGDFCEYTSVVGVT